MGNFHFYAHLLHILAQVRLPVLSTAMDGLEAQPPRASTCCSQISCGSLQDPCSLIEGMVHVSVNLRFYVLNVMFFVGNIEKLEKIAKPEEIRNIKWLTEQCQLNYNVAGLYFEYSVYVKLKTRC